MRVPFITSFYERRAESRAVSFALVALLESASQTHDELAALRKEVSEVRVTQQRRELVVVAAEAFADKFDDTWLASDMAEKFSELELMPITNLLSAAGRHEAAEFWAKFNEEAEESAEDFDPIAKA